MPIREFKPTSPGRRDMSALVYSGLTKKKPEKSLLKPLPKTGGRNNRGRITCRFRGGRVRRHYRLVDFRRQKDNIPAVVKALEYDPNRSANIALIEYEDGVKSYIIAPVGLKVGARVLSSETRIEPEPGYCMPMREIPQGTQIHNIEIHPGRGGSMARSAGTAATLMAREGRFVVVVLPSGEMRRILSACRATVGQVGNLDHQNVKIGKAGRKRKMGRRPHVRGIAMNPVDHPMGGGEKRSKGHHPQSPWGLYAKGRKTRSPKARSDNLIIRRHKKK